VPRQYLAGLCGFAVLVVGALAGCGSADSSSSATTATTPANLPSLATRPTRAGEIVVRGETSPATHGPFTFDGRYLVRFAQYAPEDPALDFAGQTPFTATLTPRRDDPRGAEKLFGAATRTGRTQLTLHGRRFLDVSFGDFPYVVRFTPRAGS